MKTIATLIATAASFAAASSASASSPAVTYTGKTSSGHRVTFQVAHGRMYNLRAGVRVNCDMCGEEILNERQVQQGGLTLCRTCADGGYYQLSPNEIPGIQLLDVHVNA